MTREDIKNQFPDATEEQITAILNINGDDVKAWKDKVPKKADFEELTRKAAEYDKLRRQTLPMRKKSKRLYRMLRVQKQIMRKSQTDWMQKKSLLLPG